MSNPVTVMHDVLADAMVEVVAIKSVRTTVAIVPGDETTSAHKVAGGQRVSQKSTSASQQQKQQSEV
ncbi:hypothetical protein QI600_004114 [Salmonella enterica]|nr:hypothetical protein [Salmonella enterica]